jgi:hypothetical protein
MKQFNNIQELWDYCAYCPFCMRNCRKVFVSVGPDDVFILVDFKKEDSNLLLECTFKSKRHIYNVDYNINCLENTFTVEVPRVQEVPPGEKANPDRAKSASFFFFVEGLCKDCHCTSAHGADLELDLLDKKISKIALERESLYFLECKDKFHVSPIHDRNVMLVSRCYVEDEELGFTESDKTIQLPLVKLDPTDQEKTVNKIKTLILFS